MYFLHLPSSPLSTPRHVLLQYHNSRKPNPVPCPVGLVVKKGWNILSSTFCGMPLPLSFNRIKTSTCLYCTIETVGS